MKEYKHTITLFDTELEFYANRFKQDKDLHMIELRNNKTKSSLIIKREE